MINGIPGTVILFLKKNAKKCTDVVPKKRYSQNGTINSSKFRPFSLYRTVEK